MRSGGGSREASIHVGETGNGLVGGVPGGIFWDRQGVVSRESWPGNGEGEGNRLLRCCPLWGAEVPYCGSRKELA